MPRISAKMAQVPASGIRKFFDIVSQMKDVISLGVGEPDFVTPWRIREACIYALEKGFTTYTSNYGLIELRELLSTHLKRLYGLEYNPVNQILVTVGVSEAIDLAFRAILDPGDEVIIPEPCFVAYKPCVVFAQGVPVPIATSPERGFTPGPEQIEEVITPRTKAIILSYPNNPTGAVISRKDLQAIVEVASRHDLWIISDEIYDKLVYGVEHTSVPTLSGAYERTVLLNGWSKAYAMTGWRIGFAAGNSEIIETMMKIHQYIMMCAPITAQMAAIEALKNGDADTREMVREYDRRRRLIVGGLNKIGLECFEPKGAFYVFPCIRKTGLSSEQFAEQLLREEKVAVVPGNVFGDCGEGFVRCAYATSLPNIQQALERIGRFVARHSA